MAGGDESAGDGGWSRRIEPCLTGLLAAVSQPDRAREDVLADAACALAKAFPGVAPVLEPVLRRLIGRSAVNRLLDKQVAAAQSEAARAGLIADFEEATQALLDEALLQIARTLAQVGDQARTRIDAALEVVRADHARLYEVIEVLATEVRDRAAVPGRPFRSTIPPAGGLPFVGRAAELAQLDELFARRSGLLVVLAGSPGIGKSELACQFARRHVPDYPGGMYLIRADGEGPPADLATLVRTAPGRQEVATLPLTDQCQAALATMGPERTLLIYDGATSERALMTWLPGHASGCDVVVTSNQSAWSARFTVIDVDALDPVEARQIVRALGGGEVDGRYGDALVENAAGLTVQLCAATQVVARALRQGRPVPELAAFFADETKGSFGGVWRALGADVRALLELASWFNGARISERALATALGVHVGWSPQRVTAAVSDARDFAIMRSAGDDALRVHDLFARFVRSGRRTSPALPQGVLEAHARDFAETARRFVERPGATDLRARFLEHPTSLDVWREDASLAAQLVGEASTVGMALRELGHFREAARWLELAVTRAEGPQALADTLHLLGECCWQVGEFPRARAWLIRATETKEQLGAGARLGESLFMLGETFWAEHDLGQALIRYEQAAKAYERDGSGGATDHVGFGTALHGIGNFKLQGMHDPQAALPFFERALGEKRRGDAQGRQDHESMGSTFHQLGECLRQLDLDEKAIGFYEQAVEFGERGDRFGRVDRASLGRTLGQIGLCHMVLDRLPEAADALTRALVAKQAGDIHGRIDDASIAWTLHNLGRVRASQGRLAEAARCFGAALTAGAKGNVFGQVDAGRMRASALSLHNVRARLRQSTPPVGALGDGTIP